MKIGFVLDDGLDSEDGVQQYILTLGKWLASQGHEVRYLVGETRRTDISNAYSMSKNIRVRFNGNRLSIPLPASQKKIKQILAEENFDILHVQVPYSPFMGARVVKHAGPSTVIVGTFHILPYGWLSRTGTYLLGLYLKFNLRRFDKFISVSEPAAVFARKTFGIKSAVVPNLVDTARFKPVARPERDKNLRLLFLGRLVRRKGCRQLLQALSILRNQEKLPDNLVVDICGSGSMRRELEEYSAKNGLSSFIRFHGYVTEQQKIKFMQEADISVFPSLAGESFGIVLIEAMAAAGGVVLAGDNDGYRSVLGPVPGSMVDAAAPEVLADQLAEIINDPQARQSIYQLQQEHIRQFSLSVVGGRILSIYEACQKDKTNQ